MLDRFAETAALRYAIGDEVTFAQIHCIEPAAARKFILIFITNYLETGGITLFCDIDRPAEEDFPASEPPLTVGTEHIVFVFLPVMIP